MKNSSGSDFSSRRCIPIAIVLLASPLGAQEIVGVRDFFPFGVYAGGNGPVPSLEAAGKSLEEQIDFTCRDLAAHHFNCVWANNLSPENLPLWLQKGREYGLRIVPQGGGMPMYLLNDGWWADRWEAAIEQEVKPFYINFARTYRDDPALLAYSIVEEIPPDSPFFPHIASITRLVAELDPHHPVIVLYNRATAADRAAREIRPAVIGYDCYPFFTDPRHGPATHSAQRSYYERQIARFYRAAASVDAPLWVMAQAWGRAPARPDADLQRQGMRPPTPAEMRYQIWAALFQGAKGLFFFAYAGPPRAGEDGYYDEHCLDHTGRPLPHYEEAARVSQALEPLKPLLLHLDLRPEAEVVYWENRPELHGRTFVHRETGDRYLMAFNANVEEAQPIDLEFGYFPHYLSPRDRFYEVLTDREYDGSSLRTVELAPGSGALYLIGQAESWERHQAWMAGHRP